MDIPLTVGVIEKVLFPVPPDAEKGAVVSARVNVVMRVVESPVTAITTFTRTTIVSVDVAPTASVTRTTAVYVSAVAAVEIVTTPELLLMVNPIAAALLDALLESTTLTIENVFVPVPLVLENAVELPATPWVVVMSDPETIVRVSLTVITTDLVPVSPSESVATTVS